MSHSAHASLELDFDEGVVTGARPLKSRRVPIQLARKRSYNGSSPTAGSNEGILRCVEATALAARDAGARAETRRSRRCSKNDVASPDPVTSPTPSHRRNTSGLDLAALSGQRGSPTKESKEKERTAERPPFEDEQEMAERHANELADLRAAQAAGGAPEDAWRDLKISPIAIM